MLETLCAWLGRTGRGIAWLTAVPCAGLTRWVRAHTSPGFMAWLRRWLERWGTLTSRWRLQPSFIIVGAQRAGTTTLYRVLSEHPSVARPTVSKGIGYFDVNYAKGPRWYRGTLPADPAGSSQARAARGDLREQRLLPVPPAGRVRGSRATCPTCAWS